MIYEVKDVYGAYTLPAGWNCRNVNEQLKYDAQARVYCAPLITNDLKAWRNGLVSMPVHFEAEWLETNVGVYIINNDFALIRSGWNIELNDYEYKVFYKNASGSTLIPNCPRYTYGSQYLYVAVVPIMFESINVSFFEGETERYSFDMENTPIGSTAVFILASFYNAIDTCVAKNIYLYQDEEYFRFNYSGTAVPRHRVFSIRNGQVTRYAGFMSKRFKDFTYEYEFSVYATPEKQAEMLRSKHFFYIDDAGTVIPLIASPLNQVVKPTNEVITLKLTDAAL